MEQSKLMARLAYQALDDKKGEDIQVIDILRFPSLQIILSLQTETVKARYVHW